MFITHNKVRCNYLSIFWAPASDTSIHACTRGLSNKLCTGFNVIKALITLKPRVIMMPTLLSFVAPAVFISTTSSSACHRWRQSSRHDDYRVSITVVTVCDVFHYNIEEFRQRRVQKTAPKDSVGMMILKNVFILSHLVFGWNTFTKFLLQLLDFQEMLMNNDDSFFFFVRVPCISMCIFCN